MKNEGREGDARDTPISVQFLKMFMQFLVKIMPNNGLARPREALLLWEILDPSLILAMLWKVVITSQPIQYNICFRSSLTAICVYFYY